MGAFLLVCVCGGLGAVARFVLNTSIQRWWNRAYPLSTFIINIIAAMLAGMAAGAYFYQTVSYSTYLLFVAGFLGGFSTFSTAINEMVSLTRTRQFTVAAFYFLTTLVVPFLAVILGWWLVSFGH
ncbi:MAG: CrcB family protein [Bifidobacterium castoris]|nr:CrcB family protein [Bifidobacterium castoris]